MVSANRIFQAGESVKLRSRFKDDTGDPAQASGVYLNIFEPDVTVFSVENALIASGIPTYLSNGIYEYDYNIPLTANSGLWSDFWFGELSTQSISGQLFFEVKTGGTIDSLGDQLYTNNLVEITINSGLLATDGASLDKDYVFEFMTTSSPAYSNVRKLRLEIGAYINNIADDTLQTAIVEASIEADQLSFSGSVTNLYKHARREWTTCKAGELLLSNLAAGGIRAKTLGDLHVEYNTTAINLATERLIQCVEKWTGQLLSGGLSKAKSMPQTAIKGITDPDRPTIGRSWFSTDTGGASRRVPASNSKDRRSDQRRVASIYTNKRWW